MAPRKFGRIAWLDGVGIAAMTSPVWIMLVVFAWPYLRVILDGRDTLEPAAHANYVRNLFELTSFVATTAVLVTAIVAFVYTNSQIGEARATRLATLYATLEARWASPEMLASKTIFGAMMVAYRSAVTALPAGTTPPDIAVFADQYLTGLRNADYAKYASFMEMVDYLEYIGMLELHEYIDIAGIDYLLGSIVIEIWSIVSRHILALRESERRSNAGKGLARTPDEYYCFSLLAEKFIARYRTP